MGNRMRLTSDQIKAIQIKLHALGHSPGPIDGLRGPMTDAAIVAFKRKSGLKARPFVGPITWSKLFPEDATREAVPRAVSRMPDMPWYDEAERMKGLHEVRNYSRLKDWFFRTVAWIDPRKIAWCGAFVESCLAKALPSEPRISNPLGARNWAKWGRKCDPQVGAVLVFWRGSRSGWKGHVGFYHSEDARTYYVLGGNQSNAVTVTRIAKSRLIDARWPVTAMDPTGTKAAGSGKGKLSTNEA